MLTMADSPTSTSGAAVQQGSVCVSPKEPTVDKCTAAGVKRENGSPKSPKMRRSCNKAIRQRNAPYDRSPGGSTCTSSDESSNEYENENVVQKKIKRIAANKRERKRMHTVNSAFDQLRDLVPTYPSNRKLSKIDTLRLACTYIQDLVSLLHNTHTIQGEDVQLQLYQSPMSDGYMQINGGYHVKSELPEFSAFSSYRLPQCIASDPSSTDYSTSESDNHSPPYFPTHNCQPTGLAARPPPLTRTNSDSSVAVYARMSPPVSMQSTCPVSGPSICQSQRQVNIPSPLATHSVQHTTITPPLLTNGVSSPHPPPPTWHRSGSGPAYTVYTQ